MEAKSTSKSASDWLSRAIGQEVALVYQPRDAFHPTDPQYAPDGQSSFSDGFPLLVAFTASLDDLNVRIARQGAAAVPMTRFRPNIVVTNDAPWDEDTIGNLKVGGLEISLVKPCARCIVTTINQSTAVKEGPEPLRTLATFRFMPGKGALFAENGVPRGTGLLRVGDAVEVLSRKPAPPIVVKQKIQP